MQAERKLHPLIPWVSCLLGFTLVATHADEWVLVAPEEGSPPARYGHSLVEWNGKAYIFGAAAVSATRCPLANDIWKYSPDVDNWEEEPPNDPPDGRMFYSIASFSDSLFILFGQEPDNLAEGILVYDLPAQSWQTREVTGPAKPVSRFQHTSCPIGGCLLIFGGRDFSGTLGDLWRYQIATDTWEQKAAIPAGYERYSQVAWTSQEALYVFGGKGQTLHGDLWRYDLASDSWSRIDAVGEQPSARCYSVAASDGSRAWIFGGVGADGRELAEVWEFDIQTGTWTRKTDGFAFQQGAAAYLLGQERPVIVLFGGRRDSGQTVLGETWGYYPDERMAPAVIEWGPIVMNERRQLILSWSSATPGMRFTVQTCTDLAAQDWHDVPPASQWPTTESSCTVALPDAQSRGFYRIIGSPQ